MGWLRFASIRSAPVIARGSGEHVHVFALGARQELRYFRFPRGGPITFVPPAGGFDGVDLGGELTAVPAALVRGSHVQVFARGKGGGFYDKRSGDDGASWTADWRALGGVWDSAPSAADASGPARRVVLGTGMDHVVYALTSVDDGASFDPTFTRVAAGPIPGEPAASSSFHGSSVSAFARFPAAVRVTAGDGEHWGDLGGLFNARPEPVFASDPVAASTGTMFSVAGRTPQHELWLGSHNQTTGQRRGGVTPGSQILGKPALAHSMVDIDDRLVVVARSTNNQLYGCRLIPGSGGGSVTWTALGASASSDPAVADVTWFDGPGRVVRACVVVARDGDRLLYETASL